MKASRAVSVSFLTSVAALFLGCGHSRGGHLDSSGQCIGDVSGKPVDRSLCGSGHGGSYGGSGAAAAQGAEDGTTRGVLGGSAAGHAGGEGSAGE
jgi:hypothetical protein